MQCHYLNIFLKLRNKCILAHCNVSEILCTIHDKFKDIVHPKKKILTFNPSCCFMTFLSIQWKSMESNVVLDLKKDMFQNIFCVHTALERHVGE